jgi:hypothetical protein
MCSRDLVALSTELLPGVYLTRWYGFEKDTGPRLWSSSMWIPGITALTLSSSPAHSNGFLGNHGLIELLTSLLAR